MKSVNSLYMKSISYFLPHKSLSAWITIILFSIVLYSNLHYHRWTYRKVIEWDVTNYYGYLPAYFIHKDITLKFVEKDPAGYGGRMEFWPNTTENGGKVIKTTMGLSFLYAPFFGLAHWIATTQGYPATGFSDPYQICVHFSAVFYLLIGLIYLRKSLLKFFNEYISSLALIVIVLGTNLFYYTTIENGMSHSFNFSLISIFMYHCFRWHEKQTFVDSILLGIVGGLIILIRPVNILVFIFPLLLYVSSYKELISKVQFFWSKKGYLFLIILFIFLVNLPQLLYWKYVTGHFLFYSYMDEHFFFSHPYILESLFSYRKGWLVYTPLMIFAMLGLYSLYKIQRQLFGAVFIFTIVNIYVVFSWWCWWYGAGYGMRPMIDCYAILALPMAAFFQQCFQVKTLLFKYIFTQVIIILVWFSIFQTNQYIGWKIHYDAMSKEAYWMHFLQSSECIDWPAHERALKAPDYGKAMKGEKEYKFEPF